jgi:hypothetical protein
MIGKRSYLGVVFGRICVVPDMREVSTVHGRGGDVCRAKAPLRIAAVTLNPDK